MAESKELPCRLLKGVALMMFGVGTAAMSTGCDEEKVTSYNAPKEAAKVDPKAVEAKPTKVETVAAADPKPESPKAEGPKAEAPKADETKPFTAGSLRAMVSAKWQHDARPRMMREATFLVGDPEKKTEVIITKLNGPAGGLLENVNRWRGQVGLPPVAEVKEADIPKIKIAGKDSYVVDVAGPDEKAPTKRQVQAVSAQDDGTYYIKIIGDAATVGEHKAAFDKFLASIEFVK